MIQWKQYLTYVIAYVRLYIEEEKLFQWRIIS